MEAYIGSDGIAPFNHNFGARRCQSHAATTWPPKAELPVPT